MTEEFFIVALANPRDQEDGEPNTMIRKVTKTEIGEWQRLLIDAQELRLKHPISYVLVSDPKQRWVYSDDILEIVDDEEYIFTETVPDDWGLEEEPISAEMIEFYVGGIISFTCQLAKGSVDYYTAEMDIQELLEPNLKQIDWAKE